MKVWVKIPEKPNAKSVITCLNSLLKELHQINPYAPVNNIKLNGKEKAIEIVLDDG